MVGSKGTESGAVNEELSEAALPPDKTAIRVDLAEDRPGASIAVVGFVDRYGDNDSLVGTWTDVSVEG